jgi:hypothetical protein
MSKISSGVDQNQEMQFSSEPCKPTTSACGKPAHFVRRRKAKARDQVVPVRFTSEERDLLRRFAEARRLSLSDFIRKAALHRKLPAPLPATEDRSAYQELARIGNNLNQLLRFFYAGKVSVIDSEIITELANEVRRLGLRYLRGGSDDR